MRTVLRFIALLALPAGALLPGQSSAQTPAEAFDDTFLAACAGAASGSALAARCLDVVGGGPGSGARRSSTAAGNALNVVPAQGRIAAQADGSASEFEARHEFDAWTLQASAGFGRSDRDDSESEAGFDNDRLHALIGVDYRLSDRANVGVALTWQRDETDFDNAAGDQEQTALSLVGHWLWTPDSRWNVFAAAGVGGVELDSRRNIDFILVYPGIPGDSDVRFQDTAFASTDGDRVVAALGVQRTLIEGGFNLRLDAGLDYERTDIDALRESGGGGFAVELPERSIRSMRSRFGFSGDFVASTRSGVVTPYGRAWWRHEFDNDGRAVSARLIDDTNATPIVFRTPDPDRNFLEAGLGVAWLFSGGRSFFVDVEALLGDDIVSGYSVSIGGNVEF